MPASWTHAINPFSWWGALSGSTDAADAQRKAGELQNDAANRGMDIQERQWAQGRADLEPFRQFGLGALNDYYARLKAGGDDEGWKRLQTDQTNAFNSQMAGRGLLGSSASVKGLSDLGAKIAEAREQRYYERMQPLLGGGGQAAGQLMQGGAAFGRGQAQLGMDGAGALGGGLMGGANTTAQSNMGLVNAGASLYGGYLGRRPGG